LSKVLVTGGAGFIGSHLCDRLVAQGDEVVVLDDLSTGQRSNLSHLERDVTVIEDSVLLIGRHSSALEGVTRIYHLAALISGHDSMSLPDQYFETNVTGLMRLMECAGHLPGVRIVYASSSTVYGNTGDVARSEETPPAPITPYALSKLAGEHLLAMYAAVFGYDFVSLRLFNVYGPRQNPHHPYANVTCKFAYAAAHRLGVSLYGDGHQTRDFVYISDVVDAFVRAADATPGTLYNVGTGEEASVLSLLEHYQRLSGTQLKVEQHEAWENDIRHIRANVSRIRAGLGFEPRVALEEGLSRTLEYFRAQAAP
jgi:UDP-glucose 4-epimerase